MAASDKTEDEIVPDPSDALEFQRVKRTKPKRRGLWMVMLMVLIGVGVGAGWYYFGSRFIASDSDNLLIIHAAEGPVKVRPKTPGGMAIAGRKMSVYDRMNGDAPEQQPERLLPLPEMPKTPPVPTPKPEQKPAVKAVEASPPVTKPLPLAKPQKLEPGKVELKKQVVKKQEPAVTVNQDMMPKAEQPKLSVVNKPQPTDSSANVFAYQIQIAAVRSNELALSEWARLKKLHGELLGGYSLNIVRVDLGADKGVFFRLRAGPIAGEDVAQALCQNLAKRKVGCLIVRPGG